jgi:hypothetical protein
MSRKCIIFDKYEFTMINGLKYVINENLSTSDYLFINEPNDNFSIHFEKEFPIFQVPEQIERNYCLFEIKKANRLIKFFCPEKQKNLNNVVWYFYVEFLEKKEIKHILPGQVRVFVNNLFTNNLNELPKIIEVLEHVKINDTIEMLQCN